MYAGHCGRYVIEILGLINLGALAIFELAQLSVNLPIAQWFDLPNSFTLTWPKQHMKR